MTTAPRRACSGSWRPRRRGTPPASAARWPTRRPDLGTATKVDARGNPLHAGPHTDAGPCRRRGGREGVRRRPVRRSPGGPRHPGRGRPYATVSWSPSATPTGSTPSTPQLGWSMTKSVTNLLVGRLVQQGEVALSDDRLRAEWTDERADITVEQLLTMTSGLKWDETYDLGTPITQMLYRERDMGELRRQPAVGARPGHLPAVLQRQHHAALRDPDRAARGRSRPAPPAALRPAGAVFGGARARRRRDAGVQLLPVGHAARLGGGRPVRPAGRRLERRAAAAGGLDGPVHDRGRRRDRGGGVRRWLVGQPDARRDPGRGVTCRRTPTSPRVTTASGSIVVPSEDLVVVRLGFSPEVDDVGAVHLAADLIALDPTS